MQLPGTTSLYSVIFERHNWDDARLRCRLLHPKAHLVVLDSEAENTALRNHLLTYPGKRSALFVCIMTARPVGNRCFCVILSYCMCCIIVTRWGGPDGIGT